MSLPLDSLRRDVPELVRSYRRDVIDELLEQSRNASTSQDAGFEPATTSTYSPRVQTSLSGRDPGLAERAAAQRAAREKEQHEKEEEFKRRTERKMAETAQRQEAEFQAMYGEVLGGLANDSGIMGETQYTLEHSARIKAGKKKDLYEEWDTEVFTKIQDRLQRGVDRLDGASIEARLNDQMSAYLHTTNTKLGVFRDVIIEADYNPFTAHQSTLRIPTGDIRDPVKRDVLKPMYERRLMGVSTPEDASLCKPMLDTKSWGDLLIKSTPYGHCMDKTGNYIVRPTSSRVVAARRSRVPMDHYDYPNFDNEAARVEQGKDGKAMPPAPGGPQRGFFGVLQQTDGAQQTSSSTCKDSWIDYKGKALPPGPEVRRGRPGLTETFQQGSNPYEDGRTLGDLWLEAKGKAKPPGPEMRRGRQGLAETLQQGSNPYQDGRTLGDIWLEAKGKRPLPGADVTIGPVINSYAGAPEHLQTSGKRQPAAGQRHESRIVSDKMLTVRAGLVEASY